MTRPLAAFAACLATGLCVAAAPTASADDDYFDDLEDYYEDLEDAREDYYDDLEDYYEDRNRGFRRSFRHGYRYAPPVYHAPRVYSAPRVYHAPPVVYHHPPTYYGGTTTYHYGAPVIRHHSYGVPQTTYYGNGFHLNTGRFQMSIR